MPIYQHNNGPFQENTWLYLNPKLKEAIIVDPGENLAHVYKQLQNYSVTHIFITHGHHDHIYGLDEVKKRYPDAIIVSHNLSKSIFSNPQKNLSQSRNRNVVAPDPDWTYNTEKATIKAGGQEWTLIHTPGHAPDHTIFLGEDLTLFGGDLLFERGGYGRTDLVGSNSGDMRESIAMCLLSTPEKSIVYPGHGNKFTIKDAKPFFRSI